MKGSSIGVQLRYYLSVSGDSVGALDVVIRVTAARPTFRREYTGKVRITEIVDEHFAKAKVISGKERRCGGERSKIGIWLKSNDVKGVTKILILLR